MSQGNPAKLIPSEDPTSFVLMGTRYRRQGFWRRIFQRGLKFSRRILLLLFHFFSLSLSLSVLSGDVMYKSGRGER